MKRKHKLFSKPKRPFDKARIEEEKKLRQEFGLKNKREIWKAEAQIKSIREKAKKLIPAAEDEKKQLYEKLNNIGFEVKSIADILSLDKKDYLERRLQTVLVKKGLASTPGEARQLITHKKVSIGGKVIGSPSYIVPVESEDKINVKKSQEKTKKHSSETSEKAVEAIA